MSSGRDSAGLFTDPTIAGLVKEQAITCSDAMAALVGISHLEISVLADVVDPALRALRLAGYQPLAMDVVDGRAQPRKIARLNFDDELTVAQADPPPDLMWMDNALDEVLYNVILYAKPYTAQAGGQGASYAVPLAASGDGWRLEAGRAQDGVDAIAIHFFIDDPSGLASVDITLAVASGPVEKFRYDITNLLQPRWAEVPWPDGAVMPPVPSQPIGLMWLFEPANWFPSATFDDNDHAQTLLKVGRDALLAANADQGSVGVFIEHMLKGEWPTRYTLKSVSGAPLRAYFRAGDFRRAFIRWFDSLTAPYAPLPDSFKSLARRLSWFDLLCYLVEAKILQPPGLPQGVLPDFEFDDLDFETVIARRASDGARELTLCMVGAFGASDDDPYGEIARITAFDLPHIDADILYPDGGVPQDQSPPLHPFEQMFSWEFIPPETGMDAFGNEFTILDSNGEPIPPRLLIVAGPGVTVSKIHHQQNEVDIRVLRKNDYGIPPWGDRIDEAQLYRPSFVPAYNFDGQTADFTHDGCLIVEKHNGMTFNFFPDLTISHVTGYPVSFPAEPHAKVEITLASSALGNVAYRADFDFVQTSNGDITSGTPVVRIWRTGDDVLIRATESTGVAMQVQIFDQPDIYKMYDHYPHMVPVADTLPEGLSIAGVPDAYMETYPLRDKLPMITAAQVAQAGLTLVPTETNAARGIDLEHAFGRFDFLLLGADLIIGLHPASIALDAAEFYYAYNTGRDRYGRPITTQDLYFMAAGIALPVSGYVLTTISKKAGPLLRARWVPPLDADPTTARRALDEGFRQVDELGENTADLQNDLVMLGNRYADDGLSVLDDAAAAAAGVGRATTNLFGSGDTAFMSYELQYHYRRWLSNEVIQAAKSMNPGGFN